MKRLGVRAQFRARELVFWNRNDRVAVEAAVVHGIARIEACVVDFGPIFIDRGCAARPAQRRRVPFLDSWRS